MKLINSKTYNINEVLAAGECMLCGSPLGFCASKASLKNDEALLDYCATCCNFVYTLLQTNTEKEVKVKVHACLEI